ncbi:MAG: UDP-3-O-[3-hydroxymyristoyl] N-acetylglucosamine deacetylase, partial [Sphingobacteriales bacterium 12-47-4]
MSQTFNPDKQHTISGEANISGTGLHTGVMVDMRIKPANPGYGIQFKRTDLPGEPVIKADCDLVTDTSRGTTLEANGGKVSTVEHLLAALTGMGVDNALVELNGPEIPIIDGSSQPFIEILEKAGVLEQDATKHWY